MSTSLTRTLIEIEQHVAVAGWDQPARLFALADTATVVAAEPGLAAALGVAGHEGVTLDAVDAADIAEIADSGPEVVAVNGHEPYADAAAGGAGPAPYVSIEQDGFPGDEPLDEALARITWPPTVLGAALVVERLMLPPSAEADLPDGSEGEVMAWVAAHPERQEVRIAVAVLRDGTREAALRLRSDDADDAVLSGSELVPGLADALEATFEP